MAVIFHNVEFRFEVDGEGDEAVFARYFDRHMRRWQAVADLDSRHERRVGRERAIVPDLYEDEA
jgi:hypothetical protein